MRDGIADYEFNDAAGLIWLQNADCAMSLAVSDMQG